MRRAVNNDWDVAQQSRDWIIERVMGIVQQESGASEFESDQNSILACATMLDMYISALREREKMAASKMNRSRSPDGGDGEKIKESST